MFSANLELPRGGRQFSAAKYRVDRVDSTLSWGRYILFCCCIEDLIRYIGIMELLYSQISLGITGIVFVSLWPEEKDKCDTYFIYLYFHCVYWLIVMVADHVLKTRHHKLRINGYLDFYQTTYQEIRTPLFITSLWNTCYLLLAVILHHTHKVDYEQYCRASEWLTPLNYIFLLTTVELVIIVPVYINYISKYLEGMKMLPIRPRKRERF